MKYMVLACFVVSATLLPAATVGSAETSGPGAQAIAGLTLIGLSLLRRSRS